ncbi:hypothetical protein NDU88_006378 [Pleurodeles waltl]|uniref:Uncharacterized protein n=1 Tax=Pleurodeles waltl TaxID=8319 RepID=A0AAV7UKW1_PLEWA|nr:hypothetical protein NDU88_006378 [Pleurodeles waltl]
MLRAAWLEEELLALANPEEAERVADNEPCRDPWELTWRQGQEEPTERIKPAKQKDQSVVLVSVGSRPGGERWMECPADGIADSPGCPGAPETPKRAAWRAAYKRGIALEG